MGNNNYRKIGIIGIILAALFFVLMILFIASNARDLMMANQISHPYNFKNIIFGVLPDEYNTGDGSRMNANNAAWWMGTPVVIFGLLFSLYFLNKGKNKNK